MSIAASSTPPILGLFQKRIEGDDCLLALAKKRFEQTGLGAEFYAGQPDELDRQLNFKPANEAPAVAHLSRGINLFDPSSRAQVLEFSRRFAGRVFGLVIHDQQELVSQPDGYLGAVRELNARLEGVPQCPWLFIEYATGLEPSLFAQFAEAIAPCHRTSVCVDVGHVGIWQTRAAFAALHPGRNVCDLKPRHPAMPALVADVQRATATALPTVRQLIQRLGAIRKPAHFHLHDGHPASTFSPFGVSDHLSFLAEIPLPFEHCGRRALPLLFGPDGLKGMLATALAALGWPRCSFTLEIHPPEGRLPLDDAAALFNHWSDKTNAERMNHWLAVLRENQQLVLRAIQSGNFAHENPSIE